MLCKTCHRPINRGSTAGADGNTRGLVCKTAMLLRDFRYPASAVGQRELRKSKGER